MTFKKMPAFTFSIVATFLVLSGCISDPGVSKNRGIAKDFSIVKNQVGCGSDYLILSKGNICTPTCETGTHIASDTELATAQKNASTTLLAYIEASEGLCIDDVVTEVRPTNAIDIKSDFCSCLNGKSDLNNDCSAFCASVTPTPDPTLYLNTIMGTDIILNTKLGNLYNWCSVQLSSDTTKPQCFLQATDGTNTISDLPVTVTPGSNSLSVKIQSLAYNKTYIVKIVEGKTGSNAQTKEFQIRRKAQTEDDAVLSGALTVAPISQYTCIGYGGYIPPGQTSIIRTSFSRVFFYFAANETPPPIPPAGGTNQSPVVCHDEQLHPGNDNAEYARLELIPQHFAMWNKTDPRFVNSDNTVLAINKTIKTRLLSEFGVTTGTVDLFKLINYPNRPVSNTTSSAAISLGYMMVPMIDPLTGKAFCPIQKDFNGTNPLLNLLKEYMDDTEGLYLAEKEAESIQENNTYKTVYGTMFVTESTIKKYGFYMENGLKIKADQSAMDTRTIYYYWPVNDSMDPLAQGNRKLFTVRSPDTLNGNVPTGQSTSVRTSDKRIGCVPKSK